MNLKINNLTNNLGIRTKLISLFLAIKVIPLLGLAWISWKGIELLSEESMNKISERSKIVSQQTQKLADTVVQDTITAIDNRSREEMERLTTDTARTIARFLYERDTDIRFATELPLNQNTFEHYIQKKTRNFIVTNQWFFDAQKNQWVEKNPPEIHSKLILEKPFNPENATAFHSRPPEISPKTERRPLFLEMTYFDLNGQEQLKAINDDQLFSSELKNISLKENTFVKSETYFQHIQNLQKDEIYVSDVIGEYVSSNIIGTITPEKSKKAGISFEPEKEGYAGRENPVGKKFRAIVRWVMPIYKNNHKIGYISLALDHAHIMNFTETLMPTEQRYSHISDASNGNYAFIWDYLGRNIAHPRHYSIIGYDPQTGEEKTPWLEKKMYQAWKKSNLPIHQFLATQKPFFNQSLANKPASESVKQGLIGLDCRFVNFAPQCGEFHAMTQYGGSGSFLILWSGVHKLTTVATIPYYTGNYARTSRGFGYVTIGVNMSEFQKPALVTKKKIDLQIQNNQQESFLAQQKIYIFMTDLLEKTVIELTVSTILMIIAVIFIAIWMANNLTNRIQYIVKGIKQFELGDFTYRLENKTNDEIGQLVDSFNNMATSIQLSIQTIDESRKEALALNESLKIATDQLEAREKILENQLISSLEYASTIQYAILPEEKILKYYFADIFTLWQPKDIVGGDIYLVEEIIPNESCLLLCVDCTGHGVGGAFVTMMIKSFIKQITNNLLEQLHYSQQFEVSPAFILQQFNLMLKTTLNQTHDHNSLYLKDNYSNVGFDGSVIYFDKKNQILKFAGAKSELYMIHNHELIVIKGNKESVGYRKSDVNYAFREHSFKILPEDQFSFYLTTDGYFDQLGGNREFPFGKRKFMRLLQENYQLPFDQQEILLVQAISEWKKSHEQNDDICVIGFKCL